MQPIHTLVVSALFLSFGLSAQTKPAPDRRDGEGGGPYERLIIRGAILVDGTGAPPRGPVTVTVRNNRITAIGRFAPRAGESGRTIDARGM